MPPTNQDILNYLKKTLGEAARILSHDFSLVSDKLVEMRSVQMELKDGQLELAAEVRQASRLTLENKHRLDNIGEETPIALIKNNVDKQKTNWGTASNIVLGVIQAVIVFLLLAQFK
jgi:hypothetical protein